MSKKNVLNVKNMNVSFKSHGQEVKAVRGVSFSVDQGEIVGLVGESGSGKSVTMKAVMGILPDNAERTAESIFLNERELKDLSDEECRKVRGKEMTMIFQDPYSALNPFWNVREIINEPLKKAGMEEKEAEERIEYLLNKVGMSKADMDKFPYEFSGGQRQRIGIARALSVNPEFIVCDEPIAALDVSIQAQVVNMLEDLQNEFGLTYLFAAHDLSMVRYISTRIGVMYLGTLVEVAESNELYTNPMHPYTKALLSAIPIVDPLKAREHKRIQLKGELPSPMNIPEGCRFVTRCPYATEACKNGVPKLQEISKGHSVACHRAKEIL